MQAANQRMMLNLDATSVKLKIAVPNLEQIIAARNASQSLRIITWNVWFDEYMRDERISSLLTIALSEGADVICLQEVVPEVEIAIRKDDTIKRVYDISPFHIHGYGCLMLVRPALKPTFTQIPLPTRMGRSLLVARCDSVTVGTVHLESLNSAPLRRQQLSEIAKSIVGTHVGTNILCGDFNFDSTRNWADLLDQDANLTKGRRAALENDALAEILGESWVDSWAALRPTDPGLTFDAQNNPYIPNPVERMRYDRLMVKGAQPCEAALLGTHPFSGVIPSDHYGLRVDIAL